MTDRHTPAQRSRNMAAVKGKNTGPEILIRKALFARGFRYRLHGKVLPGKPDIVLPKHKAVIFVNGCFWHGHDCPRFTWPKTRQDFWREKISGNQARDIRNYEDLTVAGWRIGIVWECALKGKGKRAFDEIISDLNEWISSDEPDLTIRGTVRSGLRQDRDALMG